MLETKWSQAVRALPNAKEQIADSTNDYPEQLNEAENYHTDKVK